MSRLRTVLVILCLLAALGAARAATIENRALRLDLDPETGSLQVSDKAGRQVWRQPGTPTGVRVVLPQAEGPSRAGAPIILHADMLGDARKVDGDADCSARVWLAWSPAGLLLAADVTDNVLHFGPSPDPVWERDSLEVWVGGRQLTLALSPQGSAAYAQGSERLAGGKIALKTRAGGYSVEAVLPWAWAGVSPHAGDRLRVAVGVNDADAAGREGQIYWPRGWAHSDTSTFADAVLGDGQGKAPAAPVGKGAVYTITGRTATTLDTTRTFDAGSGKRVALRVRFSLPDAGSPDLRVTAEAPDPAAPVGDIRFLEPFVLDAPHGVLAVADYGDGHVYPLDQQPFPKGSFSGDRLDMPWVGMCDLDTGRGYLLLLETSDDSWVSMQKVAGKGGRPLVAPAVVWRPQKGAFGYRRSLLYHFAAKGGYVALCKRYRRYAAGQGLVVPFTEKLKKNPTIARLFGAPDVWGDASLSFAQAARAAGVEKMLIHGRPATPADMRAVAALGYLPSEYDNYTDILPAENGKIGSNRDLIPDHVVLNADGKRMGAWITYDKKTQFMKRCPALWATTARGVADEVLKTWPFLGRFIDVTSAEGLYECYDPAHPLTRTQKRECGPQLYRVFRDRKLVMGGEHGIWWAVPYLDYIEGMQSGGYAAWPAGHLIHPKSKTETFAGPYGAGSWDAYEKWGIGHEARAPLWELVFHDCILSTWYWGDASDFLLDAAPEVTPKKDAFNILYGTIPLLWANEGGSWRKDRAVFLRTYRNTCKLQEALATAEMLSHEFLTPDHAVQRTRFSDGTVCVVNFGAKPYRLAAAGSKTGALLPQNGWVVRGPKVQQSLVLENGTPVTTISAPGYTFCDRGGVPVSVCAEGAGRARIRVEKSTASVSVRPASALAGWKPAGALLYSLDDAGRPVDVLPIQAEAGGAIRFRSAGEPASYLLLWGAGARRPDLRAAGLKLSSTALRQGQPLRATATIANAGGAPARGTVEIRLDGAAVVRKEVSLPAGGRTTVATDIRTVRADGERMVSVAVQTAGAEISALNNDAEKAVRIAPDWALWQHRRPLTVSASGVEREDEPVVARFSLPVGADAGSMRVALADAAGQPGDPVPSQLDGGVLVFLLPGKLAAGESRRLVVLWRDAGAAPMLPPAGSSWRDKQQAVVMAGYEARFENGVLSFLALRKEGKTGRSFLKNMILSSQETGWSEEPGTVEELKAQSGPVRTTVTVRKALKAGVVYTKRYVFYPHRFDLEVSVNKPFGLLSRAHYLEPCSYEDDKGNKAVVDGKGDGEEIYGKDQNPRWYAVYTPTWAHSCVALTPFGHIAYWDAGLLGAIGFVTGRTEGVRMSYVIHGGEKDASFAQKDYERLTQPATVTWEEGR